MADQGIVNDLMKMTESYLELPTDHMYDIMLDSFKKCEKGAFFFDKDPRQTTKYAYTDVTEKVHHIATATICNNMSQVDDWDFDNCVYSDNSDMISDYFGWEFAQLLLAEQCKQTYTCMNTALQAKEAYSKALEELYVQKEFIISTIAEQIILKNVNPASMKLFVLKMLESKKIDDIIKRWKDVLGPDLEKQVDLAEGYVHGSEIVEVCRNRLKTDKQCFKTEITRKCNVFDIIYDPPYPPMEGPWIQSTVYLYGQDVVKWLKSKAKDYGLFTGNYPDNVDFANPFGCFIGGTDVLMKDSSSKAIESLTVGDKIACAKGKVGVISTERVQHKHDTRYRVYGFNDEEPFFLGVHPFWTQHGWKSMFPVQSKGENPSLHCGQLEVGDFVLRAVSESSNLKYKWVEVKKIHYQSVSSKEKVYGVHTVSGSKSYHANGYVVCENYPQITLARLQQGVASLDQEGKDEMLKLRPALVKIFGDGMSDVIMKSLKETKLNRGKPEKKITSLLGDRSFEMKFVSNSNDDFKPVPQHMSYHQGELFIDGNHISNAEVYQNKKIVWSKRDDGGRWYHGVFTIRNNGVTGKCILIKSKDFNCKQIISSTELEVKMVRNDYVMKKSVEEIPKDEDEDKDGRKKMKKSTKNEEFIDFGTMCIAIHKDEVSNEDIVEAGIQYPGMNNEEFFGSPVGYDTDTLKFHVEITIDKDMFSDPDGFDRDYDRYISFEGYVDMMGQKVDGVCYVYDPACPDNEGAKYKWDGELTHSDMFLRNADKAKKMACLRYIHTDPDEDFHHMQLNKKDDVNSPSKKYVSHGALQYTEAYYDGELSTQNLEYANFPDSDAANSILMDLVSMCVTHDIDGDLRTNILGTADPDFIGFSEVKKIAEDEKFKDTFGQKFGIAYLLQGLLQSDESKKFFTEDDKQRLVSYWKGTTKNCLSQDKDYAEAQRLLNRLVHIENTTIDDNQSLQDYLDDGGEKWAKNLYEAISTYDSITSMAMADSITKGNGPYHKYVMLLFCLAPDKEYCDLLHSDILTYRLQELHEYFDGTEEEIVDKEIKDVVKEFMSKLETGELEDFNNVKAELLELKNEMQIDSMSEFSDTFANMCAGAMNYAFFETQEGSFKGRLCKGIKKVCDDYHITSKIKLVGKLVLGLGYAVGFLNCLTCLMKWDDLDDEQRATLVVDCMRYGTDIMKALFDIAADIDASLVSGNWSWKLNKIFRSACANLGIKEGKIAKMISHNMGWEKSVFEVGMGESLADIEEAGKLESRFGKFFKVSSKFLKRMTMVLSVANTALMGYRLFKDVRDDAPMYQTVLDGLQLAVGIGESVFLVLEITTDLAFVPIVGQVLAVVGVILDVILLILGATMKQKTPAQIFIEGEGHDFLQTVEIDQEALDDDDDNDDDGDSDNGSVRSRIKRIKKRIARRKRELADKKKRLENDQ